MSVVGEFGDWLASTPPSQLIQDVAWIVPATQTAHILALGIVFFHMVTFDLQVIGVLTRAKTPGWARDPLPWLWWGLGALAATGLILVIGEPRRELMSWPFRIKLLLILIATGLTLILSRLGEREPSPAARLTAALTLALWALIIVCGRWIAYINFGDEEVV